MTQLTKLALAIAVAVIGLAASLGGAVAASDRYGEQKAVYHINYAGGEEARAYLGALRNIQNHLNAVGAENMELKVVLHGNGVNLLSDAMTNETLKQRIIELKGQGVVFNVCNNTLVGRNINYETDLYDVWEADIVPSGVAELSYLQQQGFTYVKP